MCESDISIKKEEFVPKVYRTTTKQKLNEKAKILKSL